MKKLCIRKDGKNTYGYMWLVNGDQWFNITDGHTVVTDTPKLEYSEHSFKLGSWYD